MKKSLIYLAFILFPLSVTGQDVSLKVEYPSVVTAGEQFSVMWTVNSGGGEFTPPSFKGFTKLMGPQTSYSSSTQIINGKMSQETSYSYVYYLQADNEGKFVIPPATFTLKHKTYVSDEMNIEVVGSSAQKQNNAAGANNSGDESEPEQSGNDIFVNLSLDRKELYLGEHIVATVKIYTKVNLSGINEVKYPPFDGFLKTDLATPPLTSLRQERINGTAYGTGIVQQFLLFPQITGEINIDPVQLSVLVQQKSGQPDPFFGDFFATYQTIPRAVASKAVKVNVKPLPGVKPDDFSGIVGKLDIKAELNEDSVNVNDAINFKITITGNGNMKIASAPVLKMSPDVEVYDPKILDDVKNGLNGSSGQKNFEYLLIPRHHGDYTIPPVTYSYFNTSSGRYEKLTTKEFHFYARKGNEQNTGTTVYGGVAKEDVKYLGKDIRFIKSASGKLSRPINIIASKRSFYSSYAFALFAFLVILFLRREHIRRNSDSSVVRNRKAGKVAVKRLHAASICLNNAEIDKFYEETLKAIWGYLSDKLNIPVSDLTRSNAISALEEKGIEEDRIKSLTEILDACEYARFSPAASETKAETIYEGASQFIKSVENSIG
ncbi:MAG: BatD family protein [Bacteroidales bacterium]|nr:BatD family protein [Bacteroidales bacterium]